MKYFNNIVVLLFIFISQNSYAKEKVKVAVFDFKPISVPVYYAAIAKSDVEGWLVESGDFVVLERTQVDIIFQEMQLKSKGCDTTSCVVEIGKVLSSDLVVTGTVQGIGGEKIITVKIIDVRSAKIVSSNSIKFKDDKEINKAGEKIGKGVAKDIQKYDIMGKGDHERYEVYVSASFSYAVPYMSLRKLLANGYGFNLDFGLKNDNFLFGIMTGFSIFAGRNDCNQAKFFPVLITAGYNINIFNFLSITPGIGAGVNFSSISYKNNYIILQKSEETLGVNPLVRAQINLDFSINSFIKLQIGVGNSARIEKNEILPFMDFKIGALIIF